MSFKFKQFNIIDDNTAMKVGVDAVILGSAAKINNNATRVLDLGAGTGIISLMLTQRYGKLKVDALEIDKSAYKDLLFNIKSTKWDGRISALNANFLKHNFEKGYHCIISNPPFYTPSKTNNSEGRKLARYADELNPDTLCNKAFKSLTKSGELIIIYPYEFRVQFIKAAFINGFWLCEQFFISDTDSNKPKRVILKFSKEKPIILLSENLIIKKKDGTYTDEFKELTKDFYL